MKVRIPRPSLRRNALERQDRPTPPPPPASRDSGWLSEPSKATPAGARGPTSAVGSRSALPASESSPALDAALEAQHTGALTAISVRLRSGSVHSWVGRIDQVKVGGRSIRLELSDVSPELVRLLGGAPGKSHPETGTAVVTVSRAKLLDVHPLQAHRRDLPDWLPAPASGRAGGGSHAFRSASMDRLPRTTPRPAGPYFTVTHRTGEVAQWVAERRRIDASRAQTLSALDAAARTGDLAAFVEAHRREPLLAQDHSATFQALHVPAQRKPEMLKWVCFVAAVERLAPVMYLTDDTKAAELSQLASSAGVESLTLVRSALHLKRRRARVRARTESRVDWLEDGARFRRDGSWMMPAPFRSGAGNLLEIQYAARRAHHHPQSQQSAAPHARTTESEVLYPEVYGYIPQGAVSQRTMAWPRIAAARALDQPCDRALSYLEGGNVLAGRHPDGTPFALVGRDSFAITRALLSFELGHSLDDDTVLAALAVDLGVAPERLFVIGQAGEFHIDMVMSLGPNGTVYLNDSRAALERAKAVTGSDVPPEMEQKAGLRARLEDEAERELRDGGFDVIRVPWRIMEPHPQRRGKEQEVANFFNGERGLGRDGAPILLTGGAPAEYQRRFLEDCADVAPYLERVYFSPEEVALNDYKYQGGTGCRIAVTGVAERPVASPDR